MFFTGRLSYKISSMWLLIIPHYLEYLATLPCDLSLIACFLTLLFHNVGYPSFPVLASSETATKIQLEGLGSAVSSPDLRACQTLFMHFE